MLGAPLLRQRCCQPSPAGLSGDAAGMDRSRTRLSPSPPGAVRAIIIIPVFCRACPELGTRQESSPCTTALPWAAFGLWAMGAAGVWGRQSSKAATACSGSHPALCWAQLLGNAENHLPSSPRALRVPNLPQSASSERGWAAGRAGDGLVLVPLQGRSSELGDSRRFLHSSFSERLGMAVPGMQGGVGKLPMEEQGVRAPAAVPLLVTLPRATRSGDLVGVRSQNPSPRRSQTSCGCCLALGAVTATATAVTHRGGDAASH